MAERRTESLGLASVFCIAIVVISVNWPIIAANKEMRYEINMVASTGWPWVHTHNNTFDFRVYINNCVVGVVLAVATALSVSWMYGMVTRKARVSYKMLLSFATGAAIFLAFLVVDTDSMRRLRALIHSPIGTYYPASLLSTKVYAGLLVGVTLFAWNIALALFFVGAFVVRFVSYCARDWRA